MSELLAVFVIAGVVGVPADTTFSVAGATRIAVETMHGNVEIRTWDRDAVRITTGVSREALRISTSGRTVRVEPRHPFLSTNVDLKITIPMGMAVDVEGLFSSVDIEGVRGTVDVETIHGSIRLAGGTGRVSLHSVQGGVTVSGTEGDLRVHSTNGSVRITGHDGSVAAEAVNGAITMERIASSDVDATSVNGGLRYGGTLRTDGRYAFRTHNGSVTVEIPPDPSATVSVSTFSGEFESDFPVTLREITGGGRQFQFTLGSGAARLELESFSGTIRLRRGGN